MLNLLFEIYARAFPCDKCYPTNWCEGKPETKPHVHPEKQPRRVQTDVERRLPQAPGRTPEPIPAPWWPVRKPAEVERE